MILCRCCVRDGLERCLNFMPDVSRFCAAYASSNEWAPLTSAALHSSNRDVMILSFVSDILDIS